MSRQAVPSRPRAERGVAGWLGRPDEPTAVLVFLLALTALFGGSSRGNVLSQPVVELVAVLAGAWSLLHLRRAQIAAYRVPLALIGLLIAAMVVQLVPLPPGVWTTLPGRQPLAGLADQAGFAQPWRPVSLTPGATREALFSALVPLAVVLAFARVDRARWPMVVAALLILAGASALLGLLQITGRAPGLYFYSWSNEGQAVGVFANRNHQAVLLAAALPLLAAHVLCGDGGGGGQDRGLARRRRVVAGLAAVFLIPLILVTGSRAGLVLMLVGLAGSGLLYLAQRRDAAREGGSGRTRRRAARRLPALALAGIAGAVVLLGALTVFLARAEAVQRLFSQDIADEKRVRLFGAVVEIGRTYLPLGAGFGAFDPVFRLHEPFSNLNPRYFNHAHNEVLELLIEGGIPVLLLLGAWLAWLATRGVRVWRRAPDRTPDRTIARAAAIVIAMLLLASLGDYPLRTSLLAAIAMLATLMLAAPPTAAAELALDDRRPAD